MARRHALRPDRAEKWAIKQSGRKKCNSCGGIFPATAEFFYQQPGPDGVRRCMSECIRCRRSKSKITLDRQRAECFDHYGRECACCGETEPLFLTLDHVENNGADHRREIGKDGNALTRWLIANDFPDGFQTLCRNCNWGKFANGGTCPHQVK